MKKIFFPFIMVAMVLSAILSFGTFANAGELMMGEVTSIGNGMVTIREDVTGMDYQFSAVPHALIGTNVPHNRVVPGQRVEAIVSGERLVSLETLGTPMQSQSESFQRWTIVRY